MLKRAIKKTSIEVSSISTNPIIQKINKTKTAPKLVIFNFNSSNKPFPIIPD